MHNERHCNRRCNAEALRSEEPPGPELRSQFLLPALFLPGLGQFDSLAPPLYQEPYQHAAAANQDRDTDILSSLSKSNVRERLCSFARECR